jgi:hypothetical protein
MLDVVRALVRHEESECRGHQLADVLERAWAERAEECFQFGERLLDRIEIGAVRRKKPQQRSGLRNRCAHLGLFVSGEIVEDDHVTRSQGRDQDLLDIGAERGVVDRSIEDGRGGQLGRPQRRHHGVRLPVAAGRVIRDPRAARTACVATQDIRGDARFIHEDVLAGIVNGERRPPLPAVGRDIRSTLFVRVYGFF